MFKISEEEILQETTPLVLKRGLEYYRQKRIKSIQFNQERLKFDAVVLGTRSYNVAVQFRPGGELSHSSCSCPDNERTGRACKHIVSVLLLVRDKDRQGFFRELKLRQAAKQIFTFFNLKPSFTRRPVQLEVTFELLKSGIMGKGFHSALSFRIGVNDKLYVLKNVKSFIESLDKNLEIPFGKKFTFDPSIHGFSEQDRPLTGLLREMYEAEKLADNFSYGFNRGTVFRDKQVFLTNTGVKRFFSMMEGRTFRAVILDEVFEGITILKEDFPLHFTLTRESNDLLLNMDVEGTLLPLTEDGEYIFSGGRIYRISDRQKEYFKPFYLAMAFQQGRKLRFIEEDKERFISEILPFAEKAGELEIDDKVQSMIEKLPLEAEIYLDRIEEAVAAEVRFLYGERTINPFAPAGKPGDAPERILLRDMEKEGIILDIFAEADFIVKNNLIYLSGEDNIYEFAVNVIPKLQQHAALFYSEEFKKLAVRSSYSFFGRVRLNHATDLLEFSFSIEGVDDRELADIFNSLRERKKYHRLKDGSFLTLDSRELKQLSSLFDHMGLDAALLGQEVLELPKYRALYMDQHIRELGLSYLERNHAFKELVQNIREPADMDFEVPASLKNILREYQKFGYKWLKTLSEYQLGGILADDMGLGKTLQIITLILADREQKGRYPSLIVVPTSLVYNWYDEIEKFAPELSVAIVSGNREERLKQLETVMESDVVITSYALIRRDIEDYAGHSFRYCILDEAQYIKNPESQSARSVKSIKAERRFALTGTPMENNLTELWSIFDFVLPGYLFSHTRFLQKYESPIVKGEGRNELEELGRQIKPFILRRMKTEVLKELPEKIEHRMTAELTEEQKMVYMAYLSRIKNEIEEEIKQKGFSRSHIKILSGLTRLRQICCHPSVFLEDYRGESGKMQLLDEVIQEAEAGGHRVLVFSQFTTMLRLIRQWLDGKGIGNLYLDGSTPVEERKHLVKAFNEGKGTVFLISLKAGGTGLNLTGADTVIHYDPWWNPAVEEQATDRAYRIGQTRAVHVIKLITKGTIEEKIYKLQEKKKRLIDAVIQPGETMLTKLSESEIRALFE